MVAAWGFIALINFHSLHHLNRFEIIEISKRELMNAGGKRLILLPRWLGQGDMPIKHPQHHHAALGSLAHQKAMQQTIQWTSLATNKPVWWRRLMLFWKGWWLLNYQTIPALKSITSIKATRNTFRSFFALILNFHKSSMLSIALCSCSQCFTNSV